MSPVVHDYGDICQSIAESALEQDAPIGTDDCQVEANRGRIYARTIPGRSACGYATPIETRQHDRVTMERWASGLTVVYAEGARARARTLRAATTESDQMRALHELIEALDRRVPHVERVGGAKIADDARRLRAAAGERIALLRDRGVDGSYSGA